jgi:hypothetical protein
MHDGGSDDYLLPKNTYGLPIRRSPRSPRCRWPPRPARRDHIAACCVTPYLVIRWLVVPIAPGRVWLVWFAMGVALCLAAIFDAPGDLPVRTGQHAAFVFLVAADSSC